MQYIYLYILYKIILHNFIYYYYFIYGDKLFTMQVTIGYYSDDVILCAYGLCKHGTVSVTPVFNSRPSVTWASPELLNVCTQLHVTDAIWNTVDISKLCKHDYAIYQIFL